uniref:Uncharacterized protein n=1 Tax=Anguilla anguilla TaxID=7936 RepID=A0A0E9TKV1_ANGAN
MCVSAFHLIILKNYSFLYIFIYRFYIFCPYDNTGAVNQSISFSS